MNFVLFCLKNKNFDEFRLDKIKFLMNIDLFTLKTIILMNFDLKNQSLDKFRPFFCLKIQNLDKFRPFPLKNLKEINLLKPKKHKFENFHNLSTSKPKKVKKKSNGPRAELEYVHRVGNSARGPSLVYLRPAGQACPDYSWVSSGPRARKSFNNILAINRCVSHYFDRFDIDSSWIGSQLS